MLYTFHYFTDATSQKFGGSYAALLTHFNVKYFNEGTALQLVQMIVEEFPPFRDESLLEGRKGEVWPRFCNTIRASSWLIRRLTF